MATEEQILNPIARFNFRLPAEIKQRIERAAIASGVTVTDFAISAMANTADDVLDRQHSRTLSTRDSEIFLGMLENPPEPKVALLDAIKEHRRRVK